MKKRPTILLAEDEMLIAWALEEELREAGVDVVGPCATVDECLSTIEQHDIDAAILDVDLNGEQVFPAAAKLRERGVPFLFHTGRADQKRLSDFASVGVCRKPMPMSELLSRLLELMDQNGDQAERRFG